MSKGPGRIERAIIAILDGEPDNAFTTEDLCERIYDTEVEKKHRVSVLRAASHVLEHRDRTGVMASRALGGTKVYFNIDNVLSYSMARLKSDFLQNYRNRDFRKPEHWIQTEDDLKARLARGGDHYAPTRPGERRVRPVAPRESPMASGFLTRAASHNGLREASGKRASVASFYAAQRRVRG